MNVDLRAFYACFAIGLFVFLVASAFRPGNRTGTSRVLYEFAFVAVDVVGAALLLHFGELL